MTDDFEGYRAGDITYCVDPELRLLPPHYATYTNRRIRERNAENPARWPLPSGTTYERWFKDAPGEEPRTNG
jgi:hypothetical protein